MREVEKKTGVDCGEESGTVVAFGTEVDDCDIGALQPREEAGEGGDGRGAGAGDVAFVVERLFVAPGHALLDGALLVGGQAAQVEERLVPGVDDFVGFLAVRLVDFNLLGGGK